MTQDFVIATGFDNNMQRILSERSYRHGLNLASEPSNQSNPFLIDKEARKERAQYPKEVMIINQRKINDIDMSPSSQREESVDLRKKISIASNSIKHLRRMPSVKKSCQSNLS